MSTTRLLATALPHSLDPDADLHLSVFFTHRLEPDGGPGVLADFPAAVTWVKTLLGGRIDLLCSTTPKLVPTRIVSAPDAAAWAAVFDPQTPVEPFPTPQVTDSDWVSYPAHTVGEHALNLHLASALAYPLTPPSVRANPTVTPTLSIFAQYSPAVREFLTSYGEELAARPGRILARRQAEALASLGLAGRDGGLGVFVGHGEAGQYPSEPLPWRSAVEVLQSDTRGDREITRALEGLLGADLSRADPSLVMLRDTYAARHYYQRRGPAGPGDPNTLGPDPRYRERPVEGATAPRPPAPEPDFHARVGSMGNTPALMRRLGLVVDLRVDDPDRLADLVKAEWVAARFTAAGGADGEADLGLVRVLPPRTACESARGFWRATASAGWTGGLLPIGDPDRYVVLDLDPDASGLKLEQHLRDLPRALASEDNGDRTSGAPGSLRSTGFSIAQTDRPDAVRSRVRRAEQLPLTDDDGSGTGPLLGYDDVVRGLRLEVWDDVTRTWHTLHARRVDVTAGGTKVLVDEPDLGFLQQTGLNTDPGTPDDAYHLHEVIAGWDGWSLSAPRPGKVIVHAEDGSELILDEPPDEAATPVHIRTRVAPGTLPWLRYGRSYSFRVAGADLAGNAVLREDAPRTLPPDLVRGAAEQLELLRSAYAARTRAGLLGQVREGVLERLPEPDPGESLVARLARASRTIEQFTERIANESYLGTAGTATFGTRERTAAAPTLRLPDLARTGDAQLDDALLARLREQHEHRSPSERSRDEVRAAVGHLARVRTQWREFPQLGVATEVFAGIDDGDDPFAPPNRVRVPRVTTPRPFLRWQPVPPPALVARTELGTGESLQRLVIRSGLDDAAGGPAGPSTTTERHVVPPKTSQLEAELHGRFDAAIASTDPAEHRRALAWALAERGTLTDEWIADLDDANNRRHQDGIALAARPGADPEAMVTLAAIEENRDTPLGEGQYVVHDTDQLVLPYLPDPLAAGLALVCYDAGAGHTLPEPRVLQAVVVPFAGTWPAVEPLRLVLTGGAELGASVEGNVVTVTVPPGEQVRVLMSSSLRAQDLDMLGLWRTNAAAAAPDGSGGGPAGTGADPQTVAARDLLERAAVSGWTWWLTPSADLQLVHAVPRPVRPPELTGLRVLLRPAGLTVAVLAGLLEVHGPSTERFTLEADWSEWVDDLAADGPQRLRRTDVVAQSAVSPDERYGLCYLLDAVVPATGTEEAAVAMHRTVHAFADTHHREVTYAARGLTRYAEFFTPEELPAPDDPASRGQEVVVRVPSSARPAAPEVVDVFPLLLWEEGTEGDQPFAVRRTRRSGVRIWLRRPWYSSGDGELLAVVLDGPGAVGPSASSRWGRDPVLATAPVAAGAAVPLVRPSQLVLQAFAGEVLGGRARPVTGPVPTALVDLAGNPQVVVFGYRPEYHPERGQWFVDVALDPDEVLWPFVRLAVARYQPDSIERADLSPVVLTDWAQPLPERTATVNRPDPDHVQVTVSGPVAISRIPGRGQVPDPESESAVSPVDALLMSSRVVFATIQQAPPDGGSDLEWSSGPRVRLPLAGIAGIRATWTARLDLTTPLPPSRPTGGAPGADPDATDGTGVRVLLEEVEYFDADPLTGPKTGAPSRAERVVYADLVML